MAILGGLFSKKNKSKSKPPSSITSSVATDVDFESLNDESEYDHSHLHPNTIYQSPAASSSKMKLPFRRSKSKLNLPATGTPSPADLLNPSLQFTQSEPPASSFTPPQKPAVFGGYGDSGSAIYTKSLPNVNHARSESHETVKTTIPATAGKKSGGGLFSSWARARERKKSKAPPPRPPEPEEKSFNLRDFRHFDGPETALSTLGLDDTTAPLELPPARPRPRGDSTASDTSQRVSVATFREMQARRSQAGSPAPQPNSRPSTQIDGHLRSGSPSLMPPPIPSSNNQSKGRNVPPHVPHRTSTLRTSPSISKLDSDSDSDHGPSPLSVQWRSKSELGHSALSDHRTSNGPLLTSPQLKQGRSTSDASKPEKRPPMPVSVHAPARPAAIQSRSSSRTPVPNAPAPVKNICTSISYIWYPILIIPLSSFQETGQGQRHL